MHTNVTYRASRPEDEGDVSTRQSTHRQSNDQIHKKELQEKQKPDIQQTWTKSRQ